MRNVTFNYDTLVERSLARAGKAWNYGTGLEDPGLDGDNRIFLFKLHGSIDWIVAHRSESFSELNLLFGKKNTNQIGRAHV